MGSKEILILAGAAAAAWFIVQRLKSAKDAPSTARTAYTPINPLAYSSYEDRYGVNGL